MNYMAKMFCKETLCALRTIICAVTTFKSVDQLIAFVEETKGQNLTVFSCNYNDKRLRASNAYGPVHFLSEKNNNSLEELSACVAASLIYQPLLENTELNEMFCTSKSVGVFKELVLHNIKTLAISRSGSIIIDGDLLKEFARGVHPFRSMLSHSCAPNMCIASSEKKMVFTVSRPINAGEQLFDNYG